MSYNIKQVEEYEKSRVSVFLVEQLKDEFSTLSVEKELLIELFSRAMQIEQCFIAIDSHEIIGLITYSTIQQASFEISLKEVKNIMGWKSLRFYFDMMQGEKRIGRQQIYINTLVVHSKYRRQGVGTKLLKFFVHEIKGSEYLLAVLSTNQKALRLYQGFGFKTIVTKKQKFLLQLKLIRRISMKYISDNSLQ